MTLFQITVCHNKITVLQYKKHMEPKKKVCFSFNIEPKASMSKSKGLQEFIIYPPWAEEHYSFNFKYRLFCSSVSSAKNCHRINLIDSDPICPTACGSQLNWAISAVAIFIMAGLPKFLWTTTCQKSVLCVSNGESQKVSFLL